MAKNIISKEKNFSQWYQDLIQAGELADYSPVRGCMVIRPTGYAIWEKIQSILDKMFKETGHSNAYFPILIPQSFLQKESQHIEGFSPELAVVTHGGGEKLEEPLVVRPTSETIVGYMYAKWLNSYRDLPILINQWNNVMRWEMRTRMFLRTSEFLWQEGHTAHETHEEAEAETLKILKIYQTFLEDYCAIPVITGLKPEHEKFPGALRTYTLEAMMQDKKILQAGTSHNLGQNFSKAFNIQFSDRDNQMTHAWTTSWGVSTRLIGGVIMTHGDDDGLMLPPRIATTKLVLIPIFKGEDEKETVTSYTQKVYQEIAKRIDPLSIQIDHREEKRPAEKFFYWIQRGIPIRLEIGIKDVKKNGVILVRRDNKQKTEVSLDKVADAVVTELDSIQKNLYHKACELRQKHTYFFDDYNEMKAHFQKQAGIVEGYWDGTHETAQKIQEETKATIRLLLESNVQNQTCIYSRRPAQHKVIFAVAY